MALCITQRLTHEGERAVPSPCKLILEGGEIVPCIASPSGGRIGEFLLDVAKGHVPQAVLTSLIDGEEVHGTIHVSVSEEPRHGQRFIEVDQTLYFFFSVEGDQRHVSAGKLADFTI